MSKRRHRSMPGHKARFVAHWPQAPSDRVEELLVVSAGEIGPPDRPQEQHVTDQRQLRFGVMEDDVARRVARAVANVEHKLSDRDRIAINQVAIRLERLAVNTVSLSVVLKPGHAVA